MDMYEKISFKSTENNISVTNALDDDNLDKSFDY